MSTGFPNAARRESRIGHMATLPRDFKHQPHQPLALAARAGTGLAKENAARPTR
jgi:hypothetical protein